MRIVLLALPFGARRWEAIRPLLPEVFAPRLGGSCALKIARSAPERVRGIVLVSAYARGLAEERHADDAARGVLAFHRAVVDFRSNLGRSA